MHGYMCVRVGGSMSPRTQALSSHTPVTGNKPGYEASLRGASVCLCVYILIPRPLSEKLRRGLAICTVPSNQVAEFKQIMLIKNVLKKQWCLEKALDVAGGRMEYE